ncbi:MAG: hypothetical protein ACFFB5_23690 [Promethearchaeota archaeon]
MTPQTRTILITLMFDLLAFLLIELGISFLKKCTILECRFHSSFYSYDLALKYFQGSLAIREELKTAD